MKANALTAEEIANLSAVLPSWQVVEGELAKTFAFGSYLAGIEFVRRLAVAAEEMNHHPDLHIGWRKVTVRLTTHSAKALTQLDIELAQKAEALVGG
jgi:4a-hydroxytetrahydrobiopterin dehydratase